MTDLFQLPGGFPIKVIACDGEYVETRLMNSGPKTNPWMQDSVWIFAGGDMDSSHLYNIIRSINEKIIDSLTPSFHFVSCPFISLHCIALYFILYIHTYIHSCIHSFIEQIITHALIFANLREIIYCRSASSVSNLPGEWHTQNQHGRDCPIGY